MSETPESEAGTFLKAIEGAFAENGRRVELRFKRKNGTIARIYCNYDDLARVILEIQKIAKIAWEHQRDALGGRDPRIAYPMKPMPVDRYQGAISADGQLVLSAFLRSGLRLDLPVPDDGIQELIDWLEQMRDLPQRPKPSRN